MIRRFFRGLAPKILLLYAGMMAFFLVLVHLYGTRLEERYQEKIADTTNGVLQYYAGIMENELKTSELFFAQQCIQSASYLRLNRAEEMLDQYLASTEIRRSFDTFLYEMEWLDAVFYYAAEPDLFLYASHSILPGLEEALRDRIRKETAGSRGWEPFTAAGGRFLCYFMPMKESRIGGVINLDRYLERKNLQNLPSVRRTAIVGKNGFQAGGGLSEIEEEALKETLRKETDPAKERPVIQLPGGALRVCAVEVKNEGYYLIGLVDVNALPEETRIDQGLMLAGILGTVLLGIVCFAFLWRGVLTPLSHITEGLQALQEGNFAYRLEEKTSLEFTQIASAFNTMSGKIRELRIAVYEEQLERQKTELQFLQSQLDPHFLINCLNNLRTLILQGRFEDFQKMLTDLGVYLRGNMTMQKLIPLEQELKDVKAYVSLQQIRYRDRIRMEIDCEEDFLQTPVPVHILQTLVENSVKYGLAVRSCVDIRIGADLTDSEKALLQISVSDNGEGFSEEVLRMFSEGNGVFREGRECIGISNARERLRLLLGDEAGMRCRNRTEGGAQVLFTIPLKEE
ncbi:MAG: histidine kinase [Lachnospiraceae bacterium]|nr:histidine kinase [Lachnospiraceae bacterium]